MLTKQSQLLMKWLSNGCVSAPIRPHVEYSTLSWEPSAQDPMTCEPTSWMENLDCCYVYETKDKKMGGKHLIFPHR